MTTGPSLLQGAAFLLAGISCGTYNARMAKKIAGPEIERLIYVLGRLPGLGPRSARKAALALLKRRADLLLPLASALSEAADKITTCTTCGNLDTIAPCTICADPRRDPTLIVVVEEIGDLWALERAGVVSARYHVLGGHLSPLDGVGPDQLNIPKLIERAASGEVCEVLLALNATVEGQSTAFYVTEQLAASGVAVSRLAQGVPMGGELDYLDEGTLAAAIKSRRRM
jgi:recombination protein RecR